MAKINMKCNCGSNVSANVGDSLYGGVLRWYISYKCERCGCAVESDGRDEIPSEIKEAIIKEEGRWGIFINDEKDLTKVTYILKKELGFTLEQIKEIKTNLPNELISGTKNEIIRINNILNQKGIKAITIKEI